MKNPTRKELIQLLDQHITFTKDHKERLSSHMDNMQLLFNSINEELAGLMSYRAGLVSYRDKLSKTVHKKRKTSNISQTLDWMYHNGWKLQSVVSSNSKHIEAYLSYKDQDVVHFFIINNTIKSRDDTMKCAQSIMNSK